MRTIGKAQDIENKALITFLDGGIIQRIWSNGRIERIAYYEYFNFGVINHANVIGDILYWTDGEELDMSLGSFNPPRKLNIVRASALTNQYLANKLPTYDPAYNYTIVPPTPAPKVEYEGNLYVAVQDSTGQTPSNTSLYWRLARPKFVTGEIVGFDGNCFQCLQDTTTQDPTHSANWKLIEYKHYDAFTLQNIMRGKIPPLQPTWSVITDGTIKKNELRDKIFQFRSRFIYDDNEKSTWSCMSTPTLLNLEYDGYYSDPCINNTILLSLQTGTKEVVRIQIACRINNGDWVLVDDIHKYTPTFGVLIASNINYTYTFKNDIQTLPLDQTETNNLFSYTPQISNCQELIQGNRLVDADITEGYDYPDVNCTLTPRYATVPQPVETALSVSYISTAYVFVMPTFDSLIKVSILKFIIPLSTTNKITIQYFPKNETTIGQVLDGIVLEFAKNGVTAIKVGLTLSVTIPSNGAALFSLINVPDRIGGLKYSSTLNPGIVFFDELKRSCSVYKLPKIDIQSVNDQVGGTTVSFLPVPVIDFSLAGTPPIQAYSYKFCHVDNRYAFLDIAIPTTYIVADSIKRIVRINLDSAVLDYRNANPDSVVQPWTWTKGDRIRLLGYSNYDSIEYFTSEYDLELSASVVGSATTYSFPYQNIDYSRNLLVEVYRDVPANVDPTVYFECGEEYIITNPRTPIRAYGTTSGTIDMYDAFQKNSTQANAYLYAWMYSSSLGEIQIFDVSVPNMPQLLSSTNTPISNPRYMVVSGNYAYTSYTQTLQIWDVSNIANPVVVSSITLDYDDSKTVRLNAGYAYIVSGNHAKLTVINVSTPSSPVKYTAISLTGGAGNEDICFHGTKAYSSGVLTGTIDVIDISNPQIPVLGTPITGLSSPRKLCISGDYLFVTNSGANELRIFNISGTPSYVSTVGGLNDCYAVSVQGKYAYVVNYGSNTLSVIDISSITSPVVVGTASVGTNPYDLAVAGQYVYVANFTSMTISVVDVSNPTAPNTIATTAAVASYSSLSVSGISTFGSIESRNYSDLFKSDQGDLQRTAVYSLELKRKRIKGLKRWSGVYLQNTFKNDLNQNDYADYDESNETFGGITRIFEYGDILKVLQSEKVTSYYLSKAVLNQAAQSGTEIVSTSTLVLGSMHQSTERYGCQNAESLVQNGTTSYYADVNNGCFIREGTSEPVPISDNGIKNYTKALFDQIKNYYPRIVGGYDQSKGELWYTIYAYMPTGEIKITLMFNEEEKTWKSYFDFVDVGGNIPEMYGSIGQVMFAFVQGITWQHESGTDYSNFFGIDVQPKVNIVAKGNGKSVFNSVKLISNKNWKCDSVLVFDNNTYQAGMVSKLPAFVKKEGWLYAPFLRDMTTSSPTPTNNDLFNGRSLRGMTAEFELQTIESGLTQLYEVEVTTTPSL